MGGKAFRRPAAALPNRNPGGPGPRDGEGTPAAGTPLASVPVGTCGDEETQTSRWREFIQELKSSGGN